VEKIGDYMLANFAHSWYVAYTILQIESVGYEIQ
jgi:hypothetical protein